MRNKYRRLLGTSRGGHFKEPRRKLKFTSSKRRQSISLRGRYGKWLLQRTVEQVWALAKLVLIVGTLVWSVSMGSHFFRQTEFFRLKSLKFEGAIPEALPSFFPFKTGQNIFSIKTEEWERRAMEKFPEIDSISIRRTLSRNLVVQVDRKTPVAYFQSEEGIRAVDENGVLFSLIEAVPPKESLLPYVVSDRSSGRKTLVSFLAKLQSDGPGLYEKVESVVLRGEWLEVRLRDGVIVDWGAIDEKNIFDKAKNILRLLSEFSPTKIPATLKFVTNDRIVMDSNWLAITPK